VRGRLELGSFEQIEGGAQVIWNVTVEREGSPKPVCVAEFILRYYV
jgi:acyl dehydratase